MPGGKIKVSHGRVELMHNTTHSSSRWLQNISNLGFLLGRRLWTILFDSFMTDGENKSFSSPFYLIFSWWWCCCHIQIINMWLLFWTVTSTREGWVRVAIDFYGHLYVNIAWWLEIFTTLRNRVNRNDGTPWNDRLAYYSVDDPTDNRQETTLEKRRRTSIRHSSNSFLYKRTISTRFPTGFWFSKQTVSNTPQKWSDMLSGGHDLGGAALNPFM